MKLLLTLMIASMAAYAATARADSPTKPEAWVTTNERGGLFFKMVPAKWVDGDGARVVDREPFGVAYRISEAGAFVEIWRTEGWFASEGYLSEDGRYFVRFGPWASDQDNHTDLAIAFYDRGELLQSYLVRDLIKRPESLENSISHYRWRPSIQGKPNGFHGRRFHLVMIDKTTYDFDYATGDITTVGRDESARSRREIMRDEIESGLARGRELLDASTYKEIFEEHFEISRPEALGGSIFGCSLDGPLWTGVLTPKQRFDHQAQVMPVFPIRNDVIAGVSLTPQDITSALERAFKHPFISARFDRGDATGIRLRIQGDRLHWNTGELQQLIQKHSGQLLREDDLAHWAYLIIDDKERNYTSLYLNTKTGEIVLK